MLIFWYMAVALIFNPSAGCARNSARPPCRRSQFTRGTTAAGVTAVTLPRVQPAGQAGPQGPGLVGTGKFCPSTIRLIHPSVYLSVSTTRMAATSSIKGRFSIRLPPRLNPPPVVPDPIPSTEPSNTLSLGSLVTTLTVPPMDPDP